MGCYVVPSDVWMCMQAGDAGPWRTFPGMMFDSEGSRLRKVSEKTLGTVLALIFKPSMDLNSELSGLQLLFSASMLQCSFARYFDVGIT